ncbi:hypothetical protein TNCV_3506711 [Trichonephila clavipes]|uniref:Uncharacterized protein n=1 Tax=Trichonephila clavipes TaxID=2585209 RepID=A0A8X6RZ24_TRICX|nr:hypothetical protein TNCV_3506711 [Trichonephila clavipes]
MYLNRTQPSPIPSRDMTSTGEPNSAETRSMDDVSIANTALPCGSEHGKRHVIYTHMESFAQANTVAQIVKSQFSNLTGVGVP